MSTEPDSASARLRQDNASRTLIDDYLAEQQRLQTPVRRFSDAHDALALTEREAIWRDLIPLSVPNPGEQYAFEVDVDRCTGCKACVAGCHSLNGLDDEETWRDVGLLVGGTRSQPFQQTVTTACHHCADPACLNGCPVLAYEKDPLTGIVRHLDDQCIGCQYCVLKCPYDVPKYSERLGIVRKCDMCQSRLGSGEAPACVQACPTQAIRIVTVQTKNDAGEVCTDTGLFLKTAPSPDYTLPTTRYVSARENPTNVAAADGAQLRPQPPHWPLVAMLTFVPMALGGFIFDLIHGRQGLFLVSTSWILGATGLASSVLHLGQPLRAWKIFLGLRRSWLSREAVVLGGWFFLSTTVTTLRWSGTFRSSGVLETCAVAVGAAGLFCSVMVYVDTRRSFWRLSQTGPRFFGSALILGGALGFVMYSDSSYTLVSAFALMAKLAIETRCFRVLDHEDDSPSPDRQTALVLTGPLRPATALRYVSALVALALCAFAWTESAPLVLRIGILGCLFLSEGTERYLFFRAVFAPKMPGVLRP